MSLLNTRVKPPLTKITVQLSSCPEPGATHLEHTRGRHSEQIPSLRRTEEMLICLVSGAGEEKSSDLRNILKDL